MSDASLLVDVGTGPQDLHYGHNWLNRFEQLSGLDAAIAEAEITAFQRWYERKDWATAAVSDRRHVDLGTCTGRYLRWSEAQGHAYVCGVDRAVDSMRFCEPIRYPGRVETIQADFLAEGFFGELTLDHGWFDLATIMFGTINHVPDDRQADLVAGIVSALRPGGRIVASAWRPGQCHLSLYDEDERRLLEHSPVDAARAAAWVPESTSVVDDILTPWHRLIVLEKTAR